MITDNTLSVIICSESAIICGINMIVIIDYGMGNLRSVSKALKKIGGARVKISSQPRDIKKATKLVLPGVGAFGDAVKELKKRNLFYPIIEEINKKPFLGICLGMQLLFAYSEESPGVKGFGVLKGKVKYFPNRKGGVKIPQIGWNRIDMLSPKCPLFKNIPNKTSMYFCHSYYCVPEDKDIIAAETYYGKNFASAVCDKNIFGVQFHPEKSQKWGLKVLENFFRL